MAAISTDKVFRLLGLEGGVTVFVPKGRTCYYVYFRHRGQQIYRSCGTDEYAAAAVHAAEILAEVVCPRVSESSAAPASPPQVETATRRPDIAIEEILTLYFRWLAAARPGEKRPRIETAKNCRRRLRQLSRLLDVVTVAELAAKLPGLTAQKLDVSDANFCTLIRASAAVFGVRVLAFYAQEKVVIENPFGGNVPKAQEPGYFEAPARADFAVLLADARKQFESRYPREWMLFLLAAGAGLRVQEATHLHWEDISVRGIHVRSRTEHQTKSGRGRFIRISASLSYEVEKFRSLPHQWVIPNVHHVRKGAEPGQAPLMRCLRVARRLAKWLRDEGADRRNPTHWLRKVFGSYMLDQHGVLAASRALGHCNTKVTERIYAGVIGDPVANVI